jgi:hypothetical protein
LRSVEVTRKVAELSSGEVPPGRESMRSKVLLEEKRTHCGIHN